MSAKRRVIEAPHQWETLRRFCVDGYVDARRVEEETAGCIYRALEDVIALARSGHWATAFNGAARAWKQKERSSLSHSGFFAPYYRDRNGANTSDQKVVYQTCPAFIQELLASSTTTTSSIYPCPVRNLDALLGEALAFALPALGAVADAFMRAAPPLRSLLFNDRGEPILSVRVIKYTPGHLAGTNPHVDKSALSCILHNTDPPGQASLVLAPPTSRKLRLSEFSPAPEGEAVIFAGQVFDEAGFHLVRPTTHAVLSVGPVAPRYSLVVFWLMRDVDLTEFDTTVEVDDDLDVLRNYLPKATKAPLDGQLVCDIPQEGSPHA